MNKQTMAKIARDMRRSLSRHSPEILIGLGITGMVTTTVLAVKATPRALTLMEERKKELEVDKLTPIETVKTTWKCYVPTVISGATSIACIVGSNSVNARRNAALATAYKLSESAFSEYRNAVIETVGEKKERVVHDKLATKHISENPINRTEVIVTGKGKTLFLDPLSHRYFYSNVQKIDDAVNRLNFQINTAAFMNEGVTLNMFYDEIGIPGTATGDGLGWNLNTGLIEWHKGSDIVPEGEDHEGEPCIVIEFTNPPRYDGFM